MLWKQTLKQETAGYHFIKSRSHWKDKKFGKGSEIVYSNVAHGKLTLQSTRAHCASQVYISGEHNNMLSKSQDLNVVVCTGMYVCVINSTLYSS